MGEPVIHVIIIKVSTMGTLSLLYVSRINLYVPIGQNVSDPLPTQNELYVYIL